MVDLISRGFLTSSSLKYNLRNFTMRFERCVKKYGKSHGNYFKNNNNKHRHSGTGQLNKDVINKTF